MKPIYYKKYHHSSDSSFLVRYAEVPHTYNRFHFHKEYEILYNIENSGTRFVGDSISRFSNGDLVLVGPHIPHYWQSDEQYFQGNEDLKAKVVLIHFEEGFLGREFIRMPEMKKMKDLLSRASHGLQFLGRDAELIREKITQISEEKGWRQVLSMIELLCMMSEAEDVVMLSTRGYTHALKYANQERISELYHFMISNYHREVKLEEAAEKANMSPSAFCRYFKRSTTRTFTMAMNEIRIGFACRRIIDTDHTISEIAFDCGFNNISYFNRVFKQIKNVTPQQYRRVHSGTMVA